jgi:hypothetical protein
MRAKARRMDNAKLLPITSRFLPLGPHPELNQVCGKHIGGVSNAWLRVLR